MYFQQFYILIRYKINHFFEIFTKFILNNLSFDETNSLTIDGNQLFDCNSNLITSDKCIDNFNINKIIYANKDFGICFEFVLKNRNIFLKDKDFIDIIMRYEYQRNILNIVNLPLFEVNKYLIN